MDKVLVKDSTSVRYNAWARFWIRKSGLVIVSLDYGGGHTKSLILHPATPPNQRIAQTLRLTPESELQGYISPL